jgi:glyoxylase-like metal-dependent hydrolase (beta-lactamase superfamily II)
MPKAPRLAQEKLKLGYKTPLLQRFVWGSLVPVETVPLSDIEYLADGSKIIPVHTPGHAKDLTCFYLPEQKYFFSGDLYIAPKLKLLRSDENLEQLLQSINKVLELDFDTIFCPHGGVIKEGKAALRLKKKNILKLAENVQALSKKGETIEGIVLALLGKEDMTARLTRGNFCKANLVNHCLTLDIPSLQ